MCGARTLVPQPLRPPRAPRARCVSGAPGPCPVPCLALATPSSAREAEHSRLLRRRSAVRSQKENISLAFREHFSFFFLLNKPSATFQNTRGKNRTWSEGCKDLSPPMWPPRPGGGQAHRAGQVTSQYHMACLVSMPCPGDGQEGWHPAHALPDFDAVSLLEQPQAAAGVHLRRSQGQVCAFFPTRGTSNPERHARTEARTTLATPATPRWSCSSPGQPRAPWHPAHPWSRAVLPRRHLQDQVLAAGAAPRSLTHSGPDQHLGSLQQAASPGKGTQGAFPYPFLCPVEPQHLPFLVTRLRDNTD